MTAGPTGTRHTLQHPAVWEDGGQKNKPFTEGTQSHGGWWCCGSLPAMGAATAPNWLVPSSGWQAADGVSGSGTPTSPSHGHRAPWGWVRCPAPPSRRLLRAALRGEGEEAAGCHGVMCVQLNGVVTRGTGGIGGGCGVEAGVVQPRWGPRPGEPRAPASASPHEGEGGHGTAMAAHLRLTSGPRLTAREGWQPRA